MKKRPNVKDIVFDHIRACEELRDDVDFIDVYKLVMRERPESKFNPQHLSVYKSQFKREKKKPIEMVHCIIGNEDDVFMTPKYCEGHPKGMKCPSQFNREKNK